MDENVDACFYCGLPADSKDHVPPVSARPVLFEQLGKDCPEFLEVWACRECNCLLGARALWTVSERKRFIKKKLRARYKKVLAMPHWSEDEIAVLGPNAKQFILRNLLIQRITMARLKW